MGADVIKIEPPEGDQWRHVHDVAGENRRSTRSTGTSAGIVLDLHTAEGRDALHALVADADVVVHSFAPGVAERLGAGAQELRPSTPAWSTARSRPSGRRGGEGPTSRCSPSRGS